ncbi:MAG TPA: hypothetical protein VKX16_13135 [Chloroflexota bacterium]|nr:hypothetical protein [Chloroflexota bacterium]
MDSKLRIRTKRRLSVPALLGALALALGVTQSGLHVSSGHAQSATPPAPPTFVPTPIGGPPAPPAPTATSTPAPTSTATATATPSSAVSDAVFSLDAARVSKIDNPGDLSGLSAVRPGSHVWLMMYFTVRAITKPVMRSTTYTIKAGSHTIFKVTYRARVKPNQTGRYSRYQVYIIPSTLPFGKYQFRAVLAFGSRHETKIWHFSVARHDHVVRMTGSG